MQSLSRNRYQELSYSVAVVSGNLVSTWSITSSPFFSKNNLTHAAYKSLKSYELITVSVQGFDDKMTFTFSHKSCVTSFSSGRVQHQVTKLSTSAGVRCLTTVVLH